MGSDIRNVYCIGRNYALHAAELGNAVPEEPMVFMKPSHAVTDFASGLLPVPNGVGEVHFETELVIRIGRAYGEETEADKLIDGYAFGIDFTLRDVQSVLKKQGHPWLKAKGFLGSAPITAFRPFPGTAALAEQDFTLTKNGEIMQHGNIKDMIFDLQTIVHYVGTRYGLGAGDVIFTGTPAGVGAVSDGDELRIAYGGEELGKAVVKLV